MIPRLSLVVVAPEALGYLDPTYGSSRKGRILLQHVRQTLVVPSGKGLLLAPQLLSDWLASRRPVSTLPPDVGVYPLRHVLRLGLSDAP